MDGERAIRQAGWLASGPAGTHVRTRTRATHTYPGGLAGLMTRNSHTANETTSKHCLLLRLLSVTHNLAHTKRQQVYSSIALLLLLLPLSSFFLPPPPPKLFIFLSSIFSLPRTPYFTPFSFPPLLPPLSPPSRVPPRPLHHRGRHAPSPLHLPARRGARAAGGDHQGAHALQQHAQTVSGGQGGGRGRRSRGGRAAGTEGG